MERFDILEKTIFTLGAYACKAQKAIGHTFKADGSIVTETDLTISSELIALLTKLFPKANIVSEEHLTPFREGAELTFVLDPIDGTDVYSQGLPSWAISLGMLDSSLRCIGAMIYAPRWGLSADEGLFFRLDPTPSAPLLLNGKLFERPTGKDEPYQVTMSSQVTSYVDLHAFHGKARCFGSNIIHMLALLIHNSIQGALSTPCYAWDLAGAQALLEHCNFTVCDDRGEPFLYSRPFLEQRFATTGVIYSGTRVAVQRMLEIFPRINA